MFWNCFGEFLGDIKMTSPAYRTPIFITHAQSISEEYLKIDVGEFPLLGGPAVRIQFKFGAIVSANIQFLITLGQLYQGKT